MKQSVQYEHWNEFLYRQGAVCSPASLDGLLSGLLAGAEQPSAEQWLQAARELMDLAGEGDGTVDEALAALYELSYKSLQDEQLSWQLCLPDDALPLAQRSQALSDWCAAFLQGYDLAKAKDAEAAGEQVEEVLHDLAAIAELEEAPEDSNANEVYFTELTEYVRMAVINLFAESHPNSPPSVDGASIH